MRERVKGVLESDDGRLLTVNLAPGTRVYDEDLVRREGHELRTWDPQRSKLAAYLLKGGRRWPFDERARVLYLGAANGTTPSHVSDVAPHGLVYGVEFSPRSFRDLLGVAAQRPNLLPILADAGRPETFQHLVGDVDVLYMDVAQRDQAGIFARNLEAFRPKTGILMVKARSVDVTREPREVFRTTAQEVERLASYHVVESVELAPFERDHAALVLERGRAPPRAHAQEERRGPPRDDRRGPPRDARHGPPRERRGPPRGERPFRRPDERRGPPRDARDDRRGPPPRDRRPPKKG